ncbi:MAG: hypothetical protein OXP09_01790 [Gammaproteobacteria bacterium]|nr:hypothetical protein [Gammaproteobacteria bacterium]
MDFQLTPTISEQPFQYRLVQQQQDTKLSQQVSFKTVYEVLVADLDKFPQNGWRLYRLRKPLVCKGQSTDEVYPRPKKALEHLVNTIGTRFWDSRYTQLQDTALFFCSTVSVYIKARLTFHLDFPINQIVRHNVIGHRTSPFQNIE